MLLKNLIKEISQLNQCLKTANDKQISQNTLKILLQQIQEHIFTHITTETLGIWLPDPLKDAEVFRQRLWASIYCYHVADSSHEPFYESTIFGFRDPEARIPLHDHPGMFGFVKALSGRFNVSSFTWLNPHEEAEFSEQINGNNRTDSNNSNRRLARFDGNLFDIKYDTYLMV